MWTPKRILLLAGGFVVFTLIYIVYSITSLGRINTLPPLPERYLPQVGFGTAVARPLIERKQSPMERKLEMAFHRGCDEARWPVQFELDGKSVVLAAETFDIEPDGRVRLARMSLALFGKKKNDGREIEINTLRCSEAYIRFDRPVSSFSFGELNGRKIVEAELRGNTQTPIFLTNNRRTAAREDDLLVRITEGPVYYIEQTHLIRTRDHIHLEDGEKHMVDGRLVPPKAVIDARGMEMELATTAPPPRPGLYPPAKPKNENISGVKRIVLKENVVMNLHAARGGPFPGNKRAANNDSPPGQKSGGSAPRREEPAHIRIASPGTFRYELLQDHDMAYFDVPTDANLTGSPQDVTVQRLNEQAGNDMLVCKHLELRLKRRSETPSAGASSARPAAPREGNSSEQGMEIETAHATGPFVTLISDAEKLDAHGTDFFHDVSKKLTILKGTPFMEATKEDSLIQAPELRIQEIPLSADSLSPPGISDRTTDTPTKSYQQVQATGPGSIQMNNKTTGKPTMHARWNKSLLSTRDTALSMDQLTLIGAAEFHDDEHDQSLKAEELKVWLLTEDKKPAAPQAQVPESAKATSPLASASPAQAQAQTAGKAARPSQSRRPHRVVALRSVRAHSADLDIHDAGRLVVNFTDVPLSRMPPPSSSKNGKPGAASPQNKTVASPTNKIASAPENKAGSAASSTSNKAAVAPSVASPSAAASAAGAQSVAPTTSPPLKGDNRQAADQKQTQTEEKQPIDLSASSIEADVLRCGERMALDRLWAAGGSLDSIDKRGGVVVQQKPSKPGDEGVYIEGHMLKMNCTANGNILQVTGDLARLKMDKLFILGPEVNIDQVANKAWVEGEGAMQMQSDKTLDGKQLEHPLPLTIHWSRSMAFFGTFADFDGNIQAEQQNARLACQRLQVTFDRPISLKEGMRGDRPAKVSSLVGDKYDSDQQIRVEDQTIENEVLQKYQLIMGNAIHVTTIPREDVVSNRSGKNSDANDVRVSGPGSVRILQRGDGDLTLSPGKPAPNRPGVATSTALHSGSPQAKDGKAAQKQEMKLTYITFEKLMRANTLNNVASFWESVRVLNMPCKDAHLEIDLDAMLAGELPPGAMYLRCNQLQVGTTQEEIPVAPNKKQIRTYQNMDAIGQVYVKGREFTAQCDHMTFNEKKDQVIFIGEGDNYAVLAKKVAKGQPPQVMRAKKLIYYRSTGKVDGSVFRSFDG